MAEIDEVRSIHKRLFIVAGSCVFLVGGREWSVNKNNGRLQPAGGVRPFGVPARRGGAQGLGGGGRRELGEGAVHRQDVEIQPLRLEAGAQLRYHGLRHLQFEEAQ